MIKHNTKFMIVVATSWILAGCGLNGTAEPTPTSIEDELTIIVPRGEQPFIDGTIDQGEWSGAYSILLSSGEEILLMGGEGYLYFGIRGKPDPLGSICVDRGGVVAILHSSAALGTALYQEGTDAWEQIQAFSWRCRDTTNSAEAQAERAAFLEQEGWIASDGEMGATGEVEFQIEIPEGALRLAVSSIGAPDYREVAIWPEGLLDDCGNLHLLTGPIPERVDFSPEEWMTLTVAPQ